MLLVELRSSSSITNLSAAGPNNLDRTINNIKGNIMTTAYQPPASDLNSGGMISCAACKKEIHCSAAMCPHCGAQRRSSRYKSKTVAALFAFFLGGFGGHRFYLGQWWGIFYLLFFWLWIPGLIAFIEFIYFLARDSRKWDDKYNEGIPAGPNDKSGGAVTAIAIIFGGFFFIAIIGILAAVAIPAYQDYISRAKVYEVITQVQPIKVSIESHYNEMGTFPEDSSEIGLESPYTVSDNHAVTITENGVLVTFGGEARTLNSKTMIFSPVQSGSVISWNCSGGTLEDKYRPHDCRE